MSKYLELFKGAFDDSIGTKTKPENKPYVAYSTKLRSVVYTVIPKLQPDNEIWYTTSDGDTISLDTSLVSNTYENGKGIAKFEYKLTELNGGCGLPGSDWEGIAYSMFGSPAFKTKVNTISIPGTITYIRGNAFTGLEVGENFNFNGSLKDWCNIIFDNSNFYENGVYYQESGKPETIHPSQHILDGGIFTINNEEIVDLVIPDSITDLKGYNFYRLKSIKTLDLKNVQTIGDSTFEGCTSLTSIDLTNVQTIGDNAFYGCTSLNSLTIPSTVISISSNAFKGAYIQSSNFVNDSSLDAEANNYWGATVYDEITGDGLIIKGTEIIGSLNGGELNIPTYITKIGPAALSNRIMSLTYNDTIENWRKIEKYSDSYYDENTDKYVVYEYGKGDVEGTEWDYSSRTDSNDYNYTIIVTCTDGIVEECGRYWA